MGKPDYKFKEDKVLEEITQKWQEKEEDHLLNQMMDALKQDEAEKDVVDQILEQLVKEINFEEEQYFNDLLLETSMESFPEIESEKQYESESEENQSCASVSSLKSWMQDMSAPVPDKYKVSDLAEALISVSSDAGLVNPTLLDDLHIVELSSDEEEEDFNNENQVQLPTSHSPQHPSIIGVEDMESAKHSIRVAHISPDRNPAEQKNKFSIDSPEGQQHRGILDFI